MSLSEKWFTAVGTERIRWRVGGEDPHADRTHKMDLKIIREH